MASDRKGRIFFGVCIGAFFLWFFLSSFSPISLLNKTMFAVQDEEILFASTTVETQQNDSAENSFIVPTRDSNALAHSRRQQRAGGKRLEGVEYRIAFLLPTTTSHTKEPISSVDHLPMFQVLLPSFFKTAPSGDKRFSYEFYLGISEGDPFYDDDRTVAIIKRQFKRLSRLVDLNMSVKFYFMGDYTKGRLTWIWNFLGSEAYLDGCDYFYQFGDDVKLTDPWVREFIGVLKNNPFYPGFGLAAASDKGNSRTMTQVFTSRVHFEIFGSFFPTTLKNWFSDDYLTHLYGVNNSFWFTDISLHNTNMLGTRYKPEKSGAFVTETIKQGRDQIIQWISKHENDLNVQDFTWEEHYYHWESERTMNMTNAVDHKISRISVRDRFLPRVKG